MRTAWLYLLAPALLAVTTATAQPPHYQLKECCELCPLAAVPEAYRSPSLRAFTVLHQGEDGWLFRSRDLRERAGPNEAAYLQLTRLATALKSRGTQLLIVYPPSRGLMHSDKLRGAASAGFDLDLARHSYSITLRRLRAAGILVPRLEALSEDGFEDYYLRRGLAWTPAGARITAEKVAATLREQPALADWPRQKLTAEAAGMRGERGKLADVAKQLCGVGNWPRQYVPEYLIAQPASDGGAPAITLVGNEFSAGQSPFPVFLAAALGVTVANHSVARRGIEAAMHSYLRSPEFQRNPPRFLIWQLASFHELSDLSFFRELLPLATDACAQEPALLSQTLALQPGRNEALFNGDGQVRRLRARDLQIELRFSEPITQPFKLQLWFTNGQHYEASFHYSRTVDTRGRYALALRDDEEFADLTFLSADIQMPSSLPAGISARAELCPRPQISPYVY